MVKSNKKDQSRSRFKIPFLERKSSGLIELSWGSKISSDEFAETCLTSLCEFGPKLYLENFTQTIFITISTARKAKQVVSNILMIYYFRPYTVVLF